MLSFYLVITYIVGWVLTAFGLAYVNYATSDEFDAPQAAWIATLALIWPFLLLLLVPAAGAAYADYNKGKKKS